MPLGRIGLLAPTDGDAEITPIEEAPSALAPHVHFGSFVPALSPSLSLGKILAGWSSRVDRLDVPWGLERIDAAADAILSGLMS
jgi:hypothetical protein